MIFSFRFSFGWSWACSRNSVFVFDERARAFAHVVAADRVLSELGFDAQPFLERSTKPLHCSLFVASHGALWQRAELLRELHGAREGLTARHYLVGQADAQRFVGLDEAAGQNQFHRASHSDDARQALRSAIDQRHVPSATRDAHLRVLFDDANVGQARELQTAGERVTVHRGDDRLEDVGLPRVAEVAGAVIDKVPLFFD